MQAAVNQGMLFGLALQNQLSRARLHRVCRMQSFDIQKMDCVNNQCMKSRFSAPHSPLHLRVASFFKSTVCIHFRISSGARLVMSICTKKRCATISQSEPELLLLSKVSKPG